MRSFRFTPRGAAATGVNGAAVFVVRRLDGRPSRVRRAPAALSLVLIASCAGTDATERGATASPTATAAPASDTRPDAPSTPLPGAASTDPLLDGMMAISRELIAKGFVASDCADLIVRLHGLLVESGLGDDAGRRREADRLATTLIDVASAYGPKTAGLDPSRPLPDDEAQRVRIVAEASIRDLRSRLDPRYDSARWPSAPPTASAPPGYESVRWELLAGFDYREGMVLPDEVRRLHRRRVALAGYVIVLEEIDDACDFLLTPKKWQHQVHGPWPLPQYVEVRSPGGRGINLGALGEGPLTAVGVLEVGEVFDDEGDLMSVYRLNVDGPDGVFKSRAP